VSVLVVAQSSSGIPEGLMNYPVFNVVLRGSNGLKCVLGVEMGGGFIVGRSGGGVLSGGSGRVWGQRGLEFVCEKLERK
jgi:hypothetical protein